MTFYRFLFFPTWKKKSKSYLLEIIPSNGYFRSVMPHIDEIGRQNYNFFFCSQALSTGTYDPNVGNREHLEQILPFSFPKLSLLIFMLPFTNAISHWNEIKKMSGRKTPRLQLNMSLFLRSLLLNEREKKGSCIFRSWASNAIPRTHSIHFSFVPLFFSCLTRASNWPQLELWGITNFDVAARFMSP